MGGPFYSTKDSESPLKSSPCNVARITKFHCHFLLRFSKQVGTAVGNVNVGVSLNPTGNTGKMMQMSESQRFQFSSTFALFSVFLWPSAFTHFTLEHMTVTLFSL